MTGPRTGKQPEQMVSVERREFVDAHKHRAGARAGGDAMRDHALHVQYRECADLGGAPR